MNKIVLKRNVFCQVAKFVGVTKLVRKTYTHCIGCVMLLIKYMLAWDNIFREDAYR